MWHPHGSMHGEPELVEYLFATNLFRKTLELSVKEMQDNAIYIYFLTVLNDRMFSVFSNCFENLKIPPQTGWENAKVQHEVESRTKSQAEALRQAGTGPVPQTFAQDPTRPQPVASKSTSAKSKPVRRKVR